MPEPRSESNRPLPDALPRWEKPGILVGVDGSEASRAALRYAVQLAPKLDLPVHALLAWDFPSILWSDADRHPEEAYETLETSAKQLVREEARLVFPDGAPRWFSTGVRQGAAAGELIRASRDAAMLVVGGRGRGGFAGLLLGSVSNACTSHAHCPVLVVREM